MAAPGCPDPWAPCPDEPARDPGGPDAQTDPGKGALQGPPQKLGIVTPGTGATWGGTVAPPLAGPAHPPGTGAPGFLGGVFGAGIRTPLRDP